MITAWHLFNVVLFYAVLAGTLILLQLLWNYLGTWKFLSLVFFSLVVLATYSSPVKPIRNKPSASPKQVISGPSEESLLTIKDNYFSRIQLLLTYHNSTLYYKGCFITGSFAGNNWETKKISAIITNRQVQYQVEGILYWHLLGIPVGRQDKILKGRAYLE